MTKIAIFLNPATVNQKVESAIHRINLNPADSAISFSPGGRTRHMKGVGMLLVSLRGVNFGFWSHLGCSGQNAIICSREGLV